MSYRITGALARCNRAQRREQLVLPGLGWGWLEQVYKSLREVPWNSSMSDGNLQGTRLPCFLNRECAQVVEGVD